MVCPFSFDQGASLHTTSTKMIADRFRMMSLVATDTKKVYKPLRQTRWLYSKFFLVEWWCPSTPILRYRFTRCCTGVFDFHSKNLQITPKLLSQAYIYHKLRKTIGEFFRSYSELLSKFGAIPFQEYVRKGISHPVFYGDLVYKLRRVRGSTNCIASGT